MLKIHYLRQASDEAQHNIGPNYCGPTGRPSAPPKLRYLATSANEVPKVRVEAGRLKRT